MRTNCAGSHVSSLLVLCGRGAAAAYVHTSIFVCNSPDVCMHELHKLNQRSCANTCKLTLIITCFFMTDLFPIQQRARSCRGHFHVHLLDVPQHSSSLQHHQQDQHQQQLPLISSQTLNRFPATVVPRQGFGTRRGAVSGSNYHTKEMKISLLPSSDPQQSCIKARNLFTFQSPHAVQVYEDTHYN